MSINKEQEKYLEFKYINDYARINNCNCEVSIPLYLFDELINESLKKFIIPEAVKQYIRELGNRFKYHNAKVDLKIGDESCIVINFCNKWIKDKDKYLFRGCIVNYDNINKFRRCINE